MKRTWLYLKLATLMLGAVMMFGNLEGNSAFADGCSGGCDNTCSPHVCCKCQTASSCGCKIQSGETGCGECNKSGGEMEIQAVSNAS